MGATKGPQKQTDSIRRYPNCILSCFFLRNTKQLNAHAN